MGRGAQEEAGAAAQLPGVVKRGGKPVQPAVRTVSGGTGNFTFDYAAFAPTATVTLEMIGKARTVSCSISPDVLRQFR